MSKILKEVFKSALSCRTVYYPFLNSRKRMYMNSQRERVKERLEKHQRESKKTPIPNLGGENVPMDETLTGEGN